MDFKYKVGAAALGGIALDGAQYVRALAKYGAMVDAQIKQDCYILGQTRTLPAVQPPPAPLGRSPRNLRAVAFGTAALTGAICGGVAVLLIVVGTIATGGNVGQAVLGGLCVGISLALICTAVPGMFIGLVAQKREATKAYAAEGHRLLMMFHHERETIRRDLESGQIDAHTAAQRIAALMPDG